VSSLDLDRMFYMVVCNHKDGPLVYERMLADMNRGTVVAHLREGQFDDGVLAVIEFNPAEGTCREVTDDEDIRAAIDRDPVDLR
jgi:hypothetical protein